MALRRIRVAALLLVLMCTIGCDQTTKHLARTELGSHQNWISSGGIVELVLAENPGAFLSLGHWLPDFARASIFVLAVGALLLGLLVYLIRSGAGVDRITFIGLSLLCAGGISNLIDRIMRNGRVTDFVVIRVGPLHTGVFNAADVAIVGGIAILIIAYFYNYRRSLRAASEDK